MAVKLMKNENGLEHRTFNVEMHVETRADSNQRVMRGHAAVFDQWADLGWFQEKVVRGAFKDSIIADDVRALFNHDMNYVLGRNKAGTLNLSEDDKGLAVEIIPPDTQFAKDLMTLMERGDISQMSFGFEVQRDKWTRGEEGAADQRELLKVRLWDVSPVTFPAYTDTDIAVTQRDRFFAAPEEASRSGDEAVARLSLIKKLKQIRLRKKEV